MKVKELINKLEHDNKIDNIEVKKLEEKRRTATSDYYKNSYQKQIHKLNAKIEVRREILESMRGEEWCVNIVNLKMKKEQKPL